MPPETPSPRSATTSGRVTAAPGPVAVAVRLRRLWLGEVVSSRAFLRSDLGDAADEIALHRVGNAPSSWSRRTTSATVTRSRAASAGPCGGACPRSPGESCAR